MPEIVETKLPGVGVRFEFATEGGESVGVVVHRGGRREVLVYDSADPDRCSSVLSLSVEDARALSDLLATTRVSEVSSRVAQDIEGLSIDWLTVPDGSPFAGSSLGEGSFRTRTGVSIVAVVRGEETFAAPEPTFVLEGGDVAVVVGTPPNVEVARSLLNP